MVLVHGGYFGSTVSANCWRPIFDHLASQFHVYVVDKPGQGYTDNPNCDARYSMEAVIQHLYRFMKTLGLQNVHLALTPFGISLYNIISGVVDRTQLHVFNHYGHYSFQECPGEVTEQMVSFIKG